MAEHEPLDAAQRDNLSGRKNEYRAARVEGNAGRGGGTADQVVPSDDVMVSSEPMILERLADEDAHTPPGRQRTGDPPAV